MAKIAGKDVSFKLGGTAHDCTEATFDTTAEELDVTSCNTADDWREFMAGFKNGTVNFAFYLDDTETPITTYLGQTVTYEATFGSYKLSGSMLINNMSLASSVEDVSKWSATARMTGTPTEVVS